MFVDEVDIHVTAGHGGSGALSFRREKFVPRGGPDGGNGGKGGSVYLVADPHRNTLVHFRYHAGVRRRSAAAAAQGALKTGRDGDDLEIPVPVGTLVFVHDPAVPDSAEEFADLTDTGQRVLVAKGGRGGLGNAHFATSTNRAPRKHQPGEHGEERHLRLQLKLLADVGLVGFPNAGKSTLIARISAAKPKIADYPFTTLTPNLGVVTMSDERSFVVADVPGLIEGAHEGHGLGHQFLRHIERTKVLIHLVDVSGASGRDPVEDFETIRRELGLYNRALLDKPELVAANKIDAVDDPARIAALEAAGPRARPAVLPDLGRHRRGRGAAARGGLAAHQSRDADVAARQLVEAEPAAAPDYNPALVPPITRRDPDGDDSAPPCGPARRHVRPDSRRASRRRARGSARPRSRQSVRCSSRHGRRIGLTVRAHPSIIDSRWCGWRSRMRPLTAERAGRRPIWNCERDGPSFTFDTLAAAREGLSPLQIFFIIGADAFAEIATWHRYPDVLDAAHFAVVARPGTTLDHPAARLPALASRMTDGRRARRPPRPGSSCRLRDARCLVDRRFARARAAASRSTDSCHRQSLRTSRRTSLSHRT